MILHNPSGLRHFISWVMDRRKYSFDTHPKIVYKTVALYIYVYIMYVYIFIHIDSITSRTTNAYKNSGLK